MNIAPKHLLFTWTLSFSLHLTCLCRGATVSLFSSQIMALWFCVYNNLWKPLCKLTERLVVENVCISPKIHINNEEDLLLLYCLICILKNSIHLKTYICIGQFHVLMVNTLQVLDYRIQFLVHMCMIAEKISSWHQRVEDLPPYCWNDVWCWFVLFYFWWMYQMIVFVWSSSVFSLIIWEGVAVWSLQ